VLASFLYLFCSIHLLLLLVFPFILFHGSVTFGEPGVGDRIDRKFFCDVPTCTRKIFVERLTPFIEPWARVTTRLYQIVQALGFATGGMLGAHLAERLGIQTSWMTILRRMMPLLYTRIIV